LNDRAAPARSGRLRHREFSHTFVDPAHQAIKKRRAGFLPSVMRTARVKTSTEVKHEDSHAPHSIAGRLCICHGVTPARAQDPDKPVTVQIGGGYTWTLSDVRDYLGDGYNFNIGVTWEASKAIGVEGLYSFNGLGTKDFSLPVASVPGAPGVPTPFTPDMNMQYGTASLVFKSPRTPESGRMASPALASTSAR
jgi:hypothetical protein